ncbi:MAG: hypothetical protein MZV63_11890 [Marinilabiliales bacterium]|nr:hypothetical protein [Marinilabiliales bacterium]
MPEYLAALQINFKMGYPVHRNRCLNGMLKLGASLCGRQEYFIFCGIGPISGISEKAQEIKATSNLIIPELDPFSLSANLFMIGFTSTSVQVLLIREIMNITGG